MLAAILEGQVAIGGELKRVMNLYNLALPFFENSTMHPDALALYVADSSYSYSELARSARRISRWLVLDEKERPRKVGILASRTVEAYAGVLGALWSGGAYVPLNPRIPAARLIHVLKQADLDALIVDQAGSDLLSNEVLGFAPRRILLGPDVKASVKPPYSKEINFCNFGELPEAGPDKPVEVAENSLAYIIFTSGTTGQPKGVMIEAGSVAQFRSVVQSRCGFNCDDRVSQVAELTFDNSVLDMFVTWAAGAALYVVPATQLIGPAKFIRDHELTIWFSVPSTACMMERMKMLTPGSFPSLRCSIFAGEALPIATARSWQIAAPNSVVENFYGPTEVTVDCIAQRLDDPPNVTRNRGSLAIGKPFSGIKAGIVDADLKFLSLEKDGELVVAGRQVARGYFKDPDLTSKRFPMLNGERWYRTGDLAYQDSTGAFHHLGRIDNQVKILGNRVELEEVEAHLREILETDLVAAVPWPISDGRAAGIAAFHCKPGVSRDYVREMMKLRVPEYMIPQRVHQLDALPLSTSGKIDRNGLVRFLEGGKI